MSGRQAKRQPKRRERNALRRTTAQEIWLNGYSYAPRKDESVEIDGHVLNRTQFNLFKEKNEERWQIANRPGAGVFHDKHWYARQYALSDVLFEYRPRAKAKELLIGLIADTQRPLSAIASLRDYAWVGIGDSNATVAAACALVRRLADEAQAGVDRVRYFADSLELEVSTHLQDWMRRDADMETIGKEGQL